MSDPRSMSRYDDRYFKEMEALTIDDRIWYCRKYRRDRFELIYRTLLGALTIDGDVAEFGCWKGYTSSQIAEYLDEIESDKRIHCFDSFRGLDLWESEFDNSRGRWLSEGEPEKEFRKNMNAFERWTLHDGYLGEFPNTEFDRPLCWAYVDVDLYRSTHQAIDILERCLVPGGVAIFDDFGEGNFPGVKRAIEERMLTNDWIIRGKARPFWLAFAWRMTATERLYVRQDQTLKGKSHE